MPISFSRYVNIGSVVAGQSAVAIRQLIGRLFTNNALLPAQSYAEFTSSGDVGAYFGTSSPEYLRSLFYFSWISPTGQQAQRISFARWVSVACAPQIYGNQAAKALATFNAITAGSFTLSLNGSNTALGPINLSAAGTFAAVATAIQSAINAIGGGALWSSATVTYNATLSQFIFTGGVAGPCTISVTDGTQGLATALGWVPGLPESGQEILSSNLQNYAIWAPGSAIEDISASVGASATASNNFGSLLVMPALTQAQVQELALWIAGQNVQYRYEVAVTSANAAEYSAVLINNEGVALELSPNAGEYPDMIQMIQEAATDYTLRNAASNYMFKQFAGVTPSVSDDADANTYDGLRVNYYGQTQNAGVTINFYQRGIMCGNAQAPVDANVFSNESWFKSAIGAAVMSLQLGLGKISANVSGALKIMNSILGVIGTPSTPATALYNGVISVGKPFTAAQKAAITDFTGDQNAWRQVQAQGWWLDVEIVPYTDPDDNLPGYKAVYTLVYSKDDVIRYIEGENVLI